MVACDTTRLVCTRRSGYNESLGPVFTRHTRASRGAFFFSDRINFNKRLCMYTKWVASEGACADQGIEVGIEHWGALVLPICPCHTKLCNTIDYLFRDIVLAPFPHPQTCRQQAKWTSAANPLCCPQAPCPVSPSRCGFHKVVTVNRRSSNHTAVATHSRFLTSRNI